MDTIILRAIGDIEDVFVERATQTNTARRVSVAPRLKWAIFAAACLLAAVALAWFMRPTSPAPVASVAEGEGGKVPAIITEGEGGKVPAAITDVNDNNADYSVAALDRIFGLPTSNYTWDEGPDVMVQADRMLTSELRHLLRDFDSTYPDVKAAFAIVRVSSVERFGIDRAAETMERYSESQIATCSVEYDFYGDEISLETANTTVKIKQYLYGGCTGEEETNLLRVGGVYVLPLMNWQNEDFWTVYGDLDCLFEVDDKGLIESHSLHKGFQKYDGQKLAVLWEDIGYLYMNPLLRSRLAEYITDSYYWYTVAVEGNHIALYYVQYDENGQLEYEWYGWEAGDADRFSAELDAEGRVVIATDGFNIFRPVEGLTVAEVEDALARIKEYVANH
jgi:hypothetical protein